MALPLPLANLPQEHFLNPPCVLELLPQGLLPGVHDLKQLLGKAGHEALLRVAQEPTKRGLLLGSKDAVGLRTWQEAVSSALRATRRTLCLACLLWIPHSSFKGTLPSVPANEWLSQDSQTCGSKTNPTPDPTQPPQPIDCLQSLCLGLFQVPPLPSSFPLPHR